MASTAQRTREKWLAAHRDFGEQLRRDLRVAEGAATEPRHVDERLVQCIWYDQLFRAGELTTASGKRLEVLDPGTWNTGRGPDFKNARLRVAGEERVGDVEIHVQSAGWSQHGHHQDFEYNTVALHAVLHASDDRPYDELQNGTRLERLVMASVLDPDLETLRRTINVDDYPYARPENQGRCHENFIRLPERQLRGFLETAGRVRVENKIQRFQMQLASASLPQLIYQSLMTGQGYKSNKTLYFLLSKRTPVSELMDFAQDVSPEQRTDVFLSVMLHVAQLFPTQSDLFDGMDDETRAFIERLDDHWRVLSGYFRDRIMPPTKRWYSGMRPPGFPGRRLAAVAILLTRLADSERPLFQEFCRAIEHGQPANDHPKDWRAYFKRLADLFAVENESHYFTTHFTLGGKPCRPQALLGEPAARSLVFNVFLPLAVLVARQEKNKELGVGAWRVIERYPALAKNSVTDMMKRRLFAESGFDKALFQTELMQQSLFKIFHSCCTSNERTCADCTFLNAPFEARE